MSNTQIQQLEEKINQLETVVQYSLISQIGQIIMNLDPQRQGETLYADNSFVYLLCNGDTIDPLLFPELSAIYGATVPSFEDRVPRSINGTNRTVGDFQEDALQNITGMFNCYHSYNTSPTGAFTKTSNGDESASGDKGESYRVNVNFDASLVARTDTETRMKNIGVQFYVKARLI